MKLIAVKKCENCGEFNDKIFDSFDIAKKISNVLSLREYIIFLMFYAEKKDIGEIGSYFGVTRDRIKKIIENIYRKIGIKLPNVSIQEIRHAVEMSPEKFIGLEQKSIWVVSDSDTGWHQQFANDKMQAATIKSGALEAPKEIISHQLTQEPNNDMRSIDILELDVRTYKCLKGAGYTTIASVVNAHPEDIIKIKNLGRRSMHILEENLKMFGYDWRLK